MVKHRYGCFQAGGTEFAVTNPETPRAFDNFLWNDAVMSNVQQTGIGCCDYQIGDTEAVQLFTGNGRVCDFDVFGRDSLMSRLVYIRDNDTGEYWNANWEPVCAEYESYQCVHGLGYTKIHNLTKGIDAGFRIFVPTGKDPVELWSLRLGNAGGGAYTRTRSLSIFVYSQFQFRYKWGFDSYGDMLYRSAEFAEAYNAVVVRKHPHLKPHSHLTAFLTADEPVTAFDGSRDAFVGAYRTLQRPVAVERGSCTNTPGSSDATIGAVQFDLVLEQGAEKEINLILGVVENTADIELYRSKYFGQFNRYLEELQQNRQAMASAFTVHTPDEHLNRMMNYWVKQQASFGAAWCRWGWNGFRDLVQHGLGVSSFDPQRTRVILSEAFRHQYAGGLALRGWNPVDTKPYSDSALWLVFTLCAYLRETDDMEFLRESVPFFDEGEASVLEHIERALNFLEQHKGVHGLCLIKFGDWNDSLTSVGKNGQGESVWLSQAYAEARREMAVLFRRLGDRSKAEQCEECYNSIKDAVNREAWDGDWYARCFDDKGDPVGSRENEEGRIFGESQAWAMISGIAPEPHVRRLLQSCDELLDTPQGYRLLAPTFTKEDSRIGRISCLEPGICENGTIYSHVNAWFILGLLRIGEPDKAYALLKKITPGYLTGEADKKNLCPPYVFANCYYGPDHRNNAYQAEFTWVTGSVAWYQTVLSGDMLGIKADYDGLVIRPRTPSSWKEYTVNRRFQGAEYHITVRNPHGLADGRFSLKMDGAPVEEGRVPSLRDGCVHMVEYTILPQDTEQPEPLPETIISAG